MGRYSPGTDQAGLVWRSLTSVSQRNRENTRAGLTIGTPDDNLKVPAVLALVDSGGSGDISAPKRALDVGKARWVGAGSGRFDRWISLEVYVEASADVYGIAFVGALLGVVTIERVETQVRVGI